MSQILQEELLHGKKKVCQLNNKTYIFLFSLLSYYYIIMKKKIVAVVVLISIFIFVYLNYSYSSIYNQIGEVALTSPSDFKNYSIGTSSESLTYVAIGDSLTTGVGVDSYLNSYPYLIAQKISQKNNIKVNLVPFAMPGARSIYALDNFIQPTVSLNPDIVTLFIGINDVHGNISKKEFKDNYENILKNLTQKTKAKIYVINLPYIGTQDLIKNPYKYYFNRQTQKFNNSIKDLAQKYNVNYIDLYNGFFEYNTDKTYYSLDLFHPGEKGYTLWAEILYANFSK